MIRKFLSSKGKADVQILYSGPTGDRVYLNNSFSPAQTHLENALTLNDADNNNSKSDQSHNDPNVDADDAASDSQFDYIGVFSYPTTRYFGIHEPKDNFGHDVINPEKELTLESDPGIHCSATTSCFSYNYYSLLEIILLINLLFII